MLARRIIKKKLRQDKKLRRIFIGIITLVLFTLLLCFWYVYPLIVKPNLISPIQQDRKFDGKGQSRNESLKQILSVLKQKNIIFLEVSIASDSSYVIHLLDKKEVVISSQKDISQQISSLQVILTRLTMEGREYKRLDLRFDKPLISL